MLCNFVLFNVALTVLREIYFCDSNRLVNALQFFLIWQIFPLILIFFSDLIRLKAYEINRKILEN